MSEHVNDKEHKYNILCIPLFFIAYKCTLDASASKIVPIAVGAALGGLIIVVLVAYVIGRLRSRKQSTYEPLS